MSQQKGEGPVHLAQMICQKNIENSSIVVWSVTQGTLQLNNVHSKRTRGV